jgi:hypothetical protein
MMKRVGQTVVVTGTFDKVIPIPNPKGLDLTAILIQNPVFNGVQFDTHIYARPKVGQHFEGVRRGQKVEVTGVVYEYTKDAAKGHGAVGYTIEPQTIRVI